MFIDDIEVSTGEGTTSFEDDGSDGRLGCPRRSPGRRRDRGAEPQRLGPAAAVSDQGGRGRRYADTVYMGFGFEGITDDEARNEIMSRAIDYLLP